MIISKAELRTMIQEILNRKVSSPERDLDDFMDLLVVYIGEPFVTHNFDKIRELAKKNLLS